MPFLAVLTREKEENNRFGERNTPPWRAKEIGTAEQIFKHKKGVSQKWSVPGKPAVTKTVFSVSLMEPFLPEICVYHLGQ